MKHVEADFLNRKGNYLYYQNWIPNGKSKAVLLIVHGLAEHSGRYKNVIEFFIPRGYTVYSFDYTGHGKSGGKKGYIERFSYYLDDLESFLALVRSKHSENKIFIIGHSIGATISAAYAINHQKEVDGLILSGTIVKPGTSLSKMKVAIANLLSFALPKIGVDRLDVSTISRDKAVVDAYKNDPLVYHGRISARLGAELIKAMKNLMHQMPQIKLPILIMHGTRDQLGDPEGSQLLYQRVSSMDKTLKLYNDFYHEIFNEPGYEQVLIDIEEWINTHIK